MDVVDVCLLDVVQEGCFAFDILALTPYVMGAGGEGAFSNFEDGICMQEGAISLGGQGGRTMGSVSFWVWGAC